MRPSIDTAYFTANGIDFEVLTCGSGPKFALCLHGFPEHAISWRHQILHLASLGYRVWAPNLRGYGGSTRPSSIEAYALAHLLNDVEALQNAAGAESMLLLGHDWGGTLAWHYGAFNPERVEQMVIFNSPHPVRAQQSGFEFRQAPLWGYVGLLLLPGAPTWLLRDGGPYACFKQPNIYMTDFERQIYRENLAAPGALEAMANWYRGYLSPVSKHTREHPQLQCPLQMPVLNFFGGSDRVLDVSLLQGLQKLAPQIHVELYPQLEHWINQEAPQQVNSLLTQWLAHHTGARAA